MIDKDNYILKVMVGKVLPAFFLCLLAHSLSKLPIGSVLTNTIDLKTAIIPGLIMIAIIKYITEVFWQAIKDKSEEDLMYIFEKQAIICTAISLIDIYLSAEQ